MTQTWQGNLPHDVTSFVGRQQEIADVTRLVSASRMVTLTGAGGVGKSRLALQVARKLLREFPDGAWLVDLAGLREASSLSHAIAAALRLRDRSAREPETVLVEHLADKQLLLVLDNCEHLLDSCAHLVGSLLSAALRVRVLATSRELLNIPGEHIWPVSPLSVPGQAEPDPERRPRASRGHEALVLFEERTAAVRSGFALTPDNEAAVARLCRRLDGLPLAIELAAVRMRAMSVGELVDRVEDRYRLLTGGSPAAPPRHQTLRAAIEWSFDLCSEQERTLWARLSVFAAGFDLETAEDVCAGDGLAREDVFPGLAALVDKSVCAVEERQGAQVRYRLLETIRQYGCERLREHGDDVAARRRHREHYLRLAAEAEWFGPNQVCWISRLQRDYADVRSALEYCATVPAEAPSGLRLAADLLYHWLCSYYLSEGRGWLDRMLVLETAPTATRAEALWGNAWLAIIQADIPAAREMLAEARSLGERLGEPTVLAYVALFSGMAEMASRNTMVALALYRQALARHRAIGNPHGVASALLWKCMAYSYLGDSSRAVARGEDCVAVCEAAGDIWVKSYALMALGIEMWRQGDTRRATALEQESLRFHRTLDDLLGIALNFEVLALVAVADHQYEHAARLLGVLRTLVRSTGVSLAEYAHLETYRDECVRRLRDVLGERSYQDLVREGAALTPDQYFALALQEKAPVGTPRLTRRERQVAELVAQGHGNQEIADRLAIARRTAEVHVARILAKLGCASRAQIATWVREQRPSHDEGGGGAGKH
ncbi:ATP-binding protein [Allokutzneria oryzae]|uniref:LuxR C-terminal-related transcriptional regulator n=1 Tax=Allokutzneria oryzae TaxID=1378989 RepID=A0ABV5ZSK6_9PSEU